jgi:hypothetical protein
MESRRIGMANQEACILGQWSVSRAARLDRGDTRGWECRCRVLYVLARRKAKKVVRWKILLQDLPVMA